MTLTFTSGPGGVLLVACSEPIDPRTKAMLEASRLIEARMFGRERATFRAEVGGGEIDVVDEVMT